MTGITISPPTYPTPFDETGAAQTAAQQAAASALAAGLSEGAAADAAAEAGESSAAADLAAAQAQQAALAAAAASVRIVWSTITGPASVAASVSGGYLCDAAAGAITITLPNTASEGDEVVVATMAEAPLYPVTLSGGGVALMDQPEDLILNLPQTEFRCRRRDNPYGWHIIASGASLTPINSTEEAAEAAAIATTKAGEAAGSAAAAAASASLAGGAGLPSSARSGREALKAKLSAASQQAKKVCFVGDSITEQGLPAMGSGSGLGIGFTTYIEQAYPGSTYVNKGIGGNTTLDVIARIADITATAADLYVLAIGINDARYNDGRGAATLAAYITNMTTIINAMKAAGGDVVVLSIWPSFWKDQYAALGRKRTDDRINQWNSALRTNAAANWLIPYVDAHAEIVKAIDMSNVADLIPDGVHPDYAATAGKRLYAMAVLRDQIDKAEFRSDFVPTGTEFYKLRVLNNGSSLCEIRNLKVAPYHKEYFVYSADASVGISGLIGSYSGAYAGYKNKANDYPFEIILTADQLPTAITTVPKGMGNGIKAFELYRSTDPDASADPRHHSWQLVQAEYTNSGNAFNLFPRKREGVFYRVDFLDSDGTDGTGGTTGTYVKVKQIWGGVEPIRYAYANMLDNGGTSERFDLYFSAAGGSGSAYMANVANTYPLRVSFESPHRLSSLALASVRETNRNIKNWKIYRSFDPAALASPAHASWAEIATGTGDATATLTP